MQQSKETTFLVFLVGETFLSERPQDGLAMVMASQHFGSTVVLKPWNAKTVIGISHTHMCIRSIMCAG